MSLLEKLTWYRCYKSELDTIVSERKEKLCQSFESIKKLSKTLEEEVEDEFKEIGIKMTELKLNKFFTKEKELKELEKERKDKFGKFCTEVSELIEELEYFDINETDAAALKFLTDSSSTILSTSAIEDTKVRVEFYSTEKVRRTNKLRELGTKIQPLWDLLGVSDEERQSFFAKNTGLGTAVINRCEEELVNLVKQKQEKLKELINESRQRVKFLWEKLGFTEESIAENEELMKDENSTEEVFEKHEQYVAQLEEKYCALKPILDKFEKYVLLCEERTTYEEVIKDSSRLLDRRRGIRQLREEERQRKIVEKTLPSIVKRILSDGETFEKENDIVVDCLKTIKEREKNYKLKKEYEKQQKKLEKMTGTPRSVKSIRKTNTPRSTIHTPSSVRKGMALERKMRTIGINNENENKANKSRF